MLCNLIWCTTNSCLLSCDFTIDSYLGFLVCFLYNPQLEAKFSTFRQRFCTNSLKNVLVSEEMDQKLFLTFFVERAPLVWHLPESKSLFFFFFSLHLKYYEPYSNWLLIYFVRARQVYGYEVVAQAIADACLNAKLNNIYNATFVQGDLNKIDESFGNNFPKPDVVISGLVDALFYVASLPLALFRSKVFWKLFVLVNVGPYKILFLKFPKH